MTEKPILSYPTETDPDLERKQETLNLREYYQQEQLPLKREEIIETVEPLVEKITLDNYVQKIQELNEYLNKLNQRCRPFFNKYPPESTREDKSDPNKIRMMREQRREAYHQEIRVAVSSMLAQEDYIAQHPNLTPQELMGYLFAEDEEGLAPQQNITNEQAFHALAAGLTYLADHKILQCARERYQTDVSTAVKELFIYDLKEPEKAELRYEDDVGLLIITGEKDQIALNSNKNPGGFYVAPNDRKGGPLLNRQVFVIQDEARNMDNGLWQEKAREHEKDHLLFFKYRCNLRYNPRESSPSETEKRRILTESGMNPFAIELTLATQAQSRIKEFMVTELSAYAVGAKGDTPSDRTEGVFWANASIRLEKLLPPSVEELAGRKQEVLSPFFDKLDIAAQKAVYPHIRRETFVECYHAMNLVAGAIEHNLPPRQVSAALSVIGIDHIDRLKLFDPNLNTETYLTRPPLKGSFEKGETPYYRDFQRRRDPRFCEHIYTEITVREVFPRLKEKMLDVWHRYKLEGVYREQSKEKSRYTPEQIRQRYLYERPVMGKRLNTSTYRETIISAGETLFPYTKRQLFIDAIEAESPFHPAFTGISKESITDPQQWQTTGAAYMAKELALKNPNKGLKEIYDRLNTLTPDFHSSQEHRNPTIRFDMSPAPQLKLVNLVWAAHHYPEDKPILEKIAGRLLPQSEEVTGPGIYKTRSGLSIHSSEFWRAQWHGFFFDYGNIHQDSRLDEEGKKEQIQVLVNRWEELLSKRS